MLLFNKNTTMIKFIFLIAFSIGLSFLSFGQKEKSTIITGYAPAYIGKSIEIYRIQDYLTLSEELIASTTVKKDSTFQFEITAPKNEKLIIRSNKNKAFLYIQPKAKYEVLFPEKDKYDPFRPSGNAVELTFFSLDSNDINYKILGFDRWVDDFIGNFFHF